MIPYGRQLIDEDDIAAVAAVLKGDWLTQGPLVEQFETELAGVVGADHCVTFASGTAALHSACAAADLGTGDVVATSALSFVASANCARYVGARPRLLDIDQATLNLDPRRIPADVDALVAVHYAGLPLDLSSLPSRPRVVIEDAAHALGATTPDGPVGNCAHSDMCVFSFHPVKSITTGEGGAVTTNSTALAERLRRFRSHGTVRRPDLGGWYYDVVDLGYNYRITDLQCALGSSQLGKLPRFVARRRQLAARYDEALAGGHVTIPPQAPPGFEHAYHLYPVRVPERRAVYDALRAQGIGTQVHYVPIYKHPLYADLGVGAADFPNTEAAYDGLLSLPLHAGLTDGEQDVVIDALRTLV